MLKDNAIILLLTTILCLAGCYEDDLEDEIDSYETDSGETDSGSEEDSEEPIDTYETDSWPVETDSISDDTETDTGPVEPEYGRYSVCQNKEESSNPLVVVGDCFPEEGMPLETFRQDVNVDLGDIPNDLKVVESFLYSEHPNGYIWKLSLKIKNVGTKAICDITDIDAYYLDNEGSVLTSSVVLAYTHTYYANNHLYGCILPDETIYARDPYVDDLEVDKLDSVLLDGFEATERDFEGPVRSLVRPTGYRLVSGEESWFDGDPELVVDFVSDFDSPLQVFRCSIITLDDNENPIILAPSMYVRNGGELPSRGTGSVGFPWTFKVQSNRVMVTCHYKFRI